MGLTRWVQKLTLGMTVCWGGLGDFEPCWLDRGPPATAPAVGARAGAPIMGELGGGGGEGTALGFGADRMMGG